MRHYLPLFLLVVLFSFSQSCIPKKDADSVALPLSGGIQLSLHTTGGTAGMNECVQISDHWQLSSVGRRHGWVRKLESEEQRALVKAMQSFELLDWRQEDDPDVQNRISSKLTARGSGVGVASKGDAENLGNLVQKLISAKRIASR